MRRKICIIYLNMLTQTPTQQHFLIGTGGYAIYFMDSDDDENNNVETNELRLVSKTDEVVDFVSERISRFIEL
jgi:hypothetical protein